VSVRVEFDEKVPIWKPVTERRDKETHQSGSKHMDLDDFLKHHVEKSKQQTTFFHFTDTRNLDLIRKHGLLSRRRLRESSIQIPAPGGNQWSMDSADRLGLDRYVSLSLTASHPME
jgi:hypothetical protein